MNELLQACSEFSQACVTYGYAFVLLGMFLAGGYLLVRTPVLRRAFLPGSLMAGILLLLLGPQVAGANNPVIAIPAEYYEGWKLFPAYLINVVFACLFLARPLLPFKHMWRTAGPQVAFGQSLAWGQYAIGGLLTMLVLIPLFNASPLHAALIELSFEGGHGTVSGMTPVFAELGFANGRDLAMGLATVSLVTALVSGILLIHWGRHKHHIKTVHHQSAYQRAYHRRILYDLRKQGIRLREHLTVRRVLSHLILVGVAISIGWVIWQSLLLLENLTWGHQTGVYIFKHVPFFPLCMFGGMIAHVVWRQLGLETSRPLVELISSIALSLLIATAIGTMSLSYIATHLEIFLLLAITGVAWILFAFLVFAPRIFRDHWFQNGIVNMGQSMGMTATGLLLLHIVDPEDKTSSLESFGYKQLMFEPFVGGGLFTAVSMPLILVLGLPAFTIGTALICVAWLLLGVRYFGKLPRETRSLSRPNPASAKPAGVPTTARAKTISPATRG